MNNPINFWMQKYEYEIEYQMKWKEANINNSMYR